MQTKSDRLNQKGLGIFYTSIFRFIESIMITVSVLFIMLFAFSAKANAQTIEGNCTISEDWHLGEDTTITGDLIISGITAPGGHSLEGTEVYVESYKLTVKGNMYLRGGHLYITSGSINIDGDYLIENVNSSGNAVTTDAFMHGERKATVNVGGNFVYNSSQEQNDYLGKIYVKKNFTDKIGHRFSSVNLNGTSEQTLSLKKESNILELLSSRPQVRVGKYISAHIDSPITLITNESKIYTAEGITTYEDVKINASLVQEGTVNLWGASKLTVKGDYEVLDSQLYINDGATLNVDGSLKVLKQDADDSSYGTNPYMSACSKSTINVGKDFVYDQGTDQKPYSDYVYGKLYVKGNFTDKTGYNFSQVILNGDSEQTLSLLPDSYIGNLQTTRPSIRVGKYFSAVPSTSMTLVTNEKKIYSKELDCYTPGIKVTIPVTFELDGKMSHCYGEFIFKGDFIEKGGEVNISDKFTVNGNCIVEDSYFRLNVNGDVTVKGDLKIQKRDEDADHFATKPYLDVFEDDAKLTVGGDLIYDPNEDRPGAPDGDIYIGGNLVDKLGVDWGRVYMTGTSGTIDTKGTIYKLTLAEQKSKYKFTKDNCYKYLVVPDVPVSGIALNKSSITLETGGSETITATLSPEDATDKNVKWTTSNGSVARVDNYGVIYAVDAGVATITATAGEKSAVCTVTVKAKEVPVSDITINKKVLELKAGSSETLTVTVLPADATNKTVTWSSNDPSVATVDANGKVTGVKEGTTAIIAKAGDKSANCIISVSKANPYEEYGLIDAYVPDGYVDNSGSAMIIKGKENYTWNDVNGKSYWYEGEVKQGTYYDPKGVLGVDPVTQVATNRGREICDNNIKDANGNGTWFWLDSCYDGAKAVGKEVWVPYIYQDENKWDDARKREVAYESDPGMGELVYTFIKEKKGKWVRYDEEGRMLKGWVTIQGALAEKYPDQVGNTYYYDTRTGLMAKGMISIDGVEHFFDEATGVMQF